MSSTPSSSELRVALGRSYIALQSEVPTLIAEQDGRSWLAFAQKEGYHNILLVQDGDEEYLHRWINRSLATDFEHYVMVCGDAVEKRALFDKDYVYECDLPVMSVELASIADKIKFADNVKLAEAKDREAIADLLGKAFDTTSEAAIAISAGAGHSSPNVVAFKIEEEGELLGHLSISIVGDFVGVWSVAISEKARRRGFATTLLNHALAHALKSGAKYGVLLASEDGANVYSRSGWQTVESFPLLVTKDAYAQIPDFEPMVNRPWLRLEHGKIAASIIAESTDSIVVIGEDNWQVTPPSLGFALCQSRHYSQVLEFTKKVINDGRMVDIMLAGHAAQFAQKLQDEISQFYDPKEEISVENSNTDSTENSSNSAEVKKPVPTLVPDGTMPAMVYDLTRKDDEKLVAHSEGDSNIRIATTEDRVAVGSVIAKAFGGGGGGSRRTGINPWALGAGNADPSVLDWVYEVETEEGKKEVVATVTAIVRSHVVHIWGVATHPSHQRKGYSTKLLYKSMQHAKEHFGARMGFLIATKAGLPVYERMGWRSYEEWVELFHRGKPRPQVTEKAESTTETVTPTN